MKKTSIVRHVCIAMLFVGLLNSAIFLAMTWHLGGDALNGKASGGHYYLYGFQPKTGQKGYSEVSEAVFRYSQWHAYSFLVTWGLMIMAGVVLKQVEKSNCPATEEEVPFVL
jgi:hypothetical protein